MSDERAAAAKGAEGAAGPGGAAGAAGTAGAADPNASALGGDGSRALVDELFDGWEAAWSGKDPAAFGPLCTVDVHYEDPLTPEPLEGAQAIGAHAERLWEGLSDARLQRTGERLFDGRFATAPAKLLGTHRATLSGLPASGRFMIVHCVFYCELCDTRLYRVRAFFDLYDAAVQLGVLPARGTLGEKALLVLRGYGLRLRSRPPIAP
jgi:steroid delta-isomerase-like uncharacterized protein